MSDGYTREEAERLRKEGYKIVACFFCLHNDSREDARDRSPSRPYYELSQTNMVGAMIACPKHWDSEGFGLVEVPR